jgi:hypothetical protein
MSDYYTPKRSKNLYDPKGKYPFRLSRSKIELFMNCPRCFYMDRRLGVGQPPGYPFNLNSAVDFLLKKEFDVHRAKGKAHPLMEHYGVDAIPYAHDQLDIWRENFKGITTINKDLNLEFSGAVDDIWVNPKGELIIVDYKSTAKDSEVTLDAAWQDSYKRQMEIYQWLFRQNGFKVSDTGYFVYCNGKRDAKAFDAKLEFDIKLIPYTGSDKWVNGVIKKIKECLDGNLPNYTPGCDYCEYRQAAQTVETVPPAKPRGKTRQKQTSLF